jgi:hypothetical protein
MTSFAFNGARASRHSSHLLRAALLGLCALALGCEPEMETDASVTDSAVTPADASGASTDAGGGTLDATPPAGNDAAPPVRSDAGVHDSAVSDSAVSDSAVLDSAVLDSAVLDSAVLDSAVLDSAVLDSAVLDSATSEAGASDGGSSVDAHATQDAATTDASSPGDASAQDAAQAVHDRTGEVRWNVREGRGSDLCPHQWVALWKDDTLTRYDPTPPGFACYLNCDLPTDLDAGEATFSMVTNEMDMFLMFRARVMLGYSTESFRTNFLRAQVHWKTPTKTSIGSGIMEFASMEPTVEIVSYQAPLLHVRMHANAVWATNSFNDDSTVPYICIVEGPQGTVLTVCTRSECGYSTDDPANGVSLTLDLTLPIQQPTP